MTILIADDHPMLRDALARTLRVVEPDAAIVEAADCASAERALQQHVVALALVDLHMPGMGGVDGVRRLHARFPAVTLAVVSGDDDPATIRSCIAAGAVGFLPKSEPAHVLQQAVRLLRCGGTYMPSQALADLHRITPLRPEGSGLTPRQQAVLRSLMQGHPNKLIARELGLTEGTVKIHIAAILRALQARNRTEAVLAARRLGLAV